MKHLLLPVTLLLAPREAAAADSYLDAGVGRVDITPGEAVVLAGSPTPKKSSAVGTRLYVRALVLSAGGQRATVRNHG